MSGLGPGVFLNLSARENVLSTSDSFFCRRTRPLSLCLKSFTSFPDQLKAVSENLDDRSFLWLWTWAFVAVSSAGYAAINLIGSTPEEAGGVLGAVRFLFEVGLPIGMCVLAAWFGVEEWRSGKSSA